MNQALYAHMNNKRKMKIKKKKCALRAGGVAQAVECLPSKHKALSSNTSIARTKQKKKKCAL
jgi:hypothetical protein